MTDYTSDREPVLAICRPHGHMYPHMQYLPVDYRGEEVHETFCVISPCPSCGGVATVSTTRMTDALRAMLARRTAREQEEARAEVLGPLAVAALGQLVTELRALREEQPLVDAELLALRSKVAGLDERVSTVELAKTVAEAAPTAAPLFLRILRDPAFGNTVSALAFVVAVLALVLGAS